MNKNIFGNPTLPPQQYAQQNFRPLLQFLQNLITRPPNAFGPLDPGSLYGAFKQNPQETMTSAVMGMSSPLNEKPPVGFLVKPPSVGSFLSNIEKSRFKTPQDIIGHIDQHGAGLGVNYGNVSNPPSLPSPVSVGLPQRTQLMGREKTILDLVHGLSGNPPMTFKAIASKYGMTRQMVSKIYYSAINVLNRIPKK